MAQHVTFENPRGGIGYRMRTGGVAGAHEVLPAGTSQMPIEKWRELKDTRITATGKVRGTGGRVKDAPTYAEYFAAFGVKTFWPEPEPEARGRK